MTKGNCYTWAYKFLTQGQASRDPEARLVHGMVNISGHGGKRIWHGWVEWDGQVFDELHPDGILQDTFYTQLQPTQLKKYNEHQAMVASMKSKNEAGNPHYGPWHGPESKFMKREFTKGKVQAMTTRITAEPEAKDLMRIKDILIKAHGDPDKARQLAGNMAKAITGVDKAKRRAEAAEQLAKEPRYRVVKAVLQALSLIFKRRVRELGGSRAMAEVQATPRNVAPDKRQLAIAGQLGKLGEWDLMREVMGLRWVGVKPRSDEVSARYNRLISIACKLRDKEPGLAKKLRTEALAMLEHED